MEGVKHLTRTFFTYALVWVAVIASAQFYYLGWLNLHHILWAGLSLGFLLTLFHYIKKKTEAYIPYSLLYFVALLLLAYLLITEHPAVMEAVDWILGFPLPREGNAVYHVEGNSLTLPNEGLALEIHQEVNRVREERGLPPYEWDGKLALAAYRYAKRLAEEGVLTHHLGNESLLERYRRQGIRCGDYIGVEEGGENLFWGESPSLLPKGVVGGWLASPSHRENLLSKGFTREGIGVVIKEGEVYVVQELC